MHENHSTDWCVSRKPSWPWCQWQLQTVLTSWETLPAMTLEEKIIVTEKKIMGKWNEVMAFLITLTLENCCYSAVTTSVLDLLTPFSRMLKCMAIHNFLCLPPFCLFLSLFMLSSVALICFLLLEFAAHSLCEETSVIWNTFVFSQTEKKHYRVGWCDFVHECVWPLSVATGAVFFPFFVCLPLAVSDLIGPLYTLSHKNNPDN